MSDSRTMMSQGRGETVGVDCRRCGAREVVKSKYRGGEALIVSLLPCNVHRCLECYSRFWVTEAIFVNSRRAWFWGSAIIIGLIIVTLKVQMSLQVSDVNRTAEFIPQFDSYIEREVVSPDVDVDKKPQINASDVLSNVGGGNDSVIEPLLGLTNGESTLSDEQSLELELVKGLAENADVVQQESLERLDEAVVEDSAALESLLKVDVSYQVERWRNAWESGLIDYYLSFYSKEFQPSNGGSYGNWVDQRKSRVTPNKKLDLVLSNFDVSFSDDFTQSTIVFDQDYNSKTYSEQSRKKMVWVKINDAWQIVSEVQISN